MDKLIIMSFNFYKIKNIILLNNVNPQKLSHLQKLSHFQIYSTILYLNIKRILKREILI